MEHELPDQQVDRAGPSRRPVAKEERSGTEQDLASTVGNRAFSSLVQRASERSQGAGPLDPEIANEIQSARSGGAVLDDEVRADMEGHLGTDLSSARLHTGSTADRLSRSVQAEAFTTGSDIFFRSGNYNPSSSDGRRLLAHELTHVVQQGSGSVGGESRVSDPDEPHEREAKEVGDLVASQPMSAAVDGGGSDNPTVSREEAAEEEDEPMAVDASVSREEDNEALEDDSAG